MAPTPGGSAPPSPSLAGNAPSAWPEGLLGKSQTDDLGPNFTNAWAGVIDGQYVPQACRCSNPS